MRQMKRGHYEEDTFQKTMNDLIKYVTRHRDIAIVVGMIVLVGAGIIIYRTSRGETINPDAEILHTQVMGYIKTGRFQEAEGILMELIDQYGNTRAGKIGLYYMGVLKYHTGQFAEALDYFQKFMSKERNDPLLTPSAYFGAACAAEGLKDYDQATKYYEKVAHNKDSPMYHIGKLGYARTQGLLGNKEKAQELLNELVDEDPPPDIAMDAKFYIGYFNE
jgi:tetratricopeptide (TPR) repeat protein